MPYFQAGRPLKQALVQQASPSTAPPPSGLGLGLGQVRVRVRVIVRVRGGDKQIVIILHYTGLVLYISDSAAVIYIF